MVGKNVFLRALEPEDLPVMYTWENDRDNWMVSNTTAPFSKHILEKFIETSSQDIYANRQLRLMVGEVSTGDTVGAVDVFDVDPDHQRAALGILIAPEYRRKGYGLESILLAKEYLLKDVRLHQVYCHVMADNEASVRLFQRAGFTECGRLREWMRTRDGFVDMWVMQCLNE